MNELLRMSATRIAGLIRTREIKPSEAVDSYIRRIVAVNPRINAMVSDRFEQAREEASAADQRLETADPDTLPPLFGVPCTIKECFALTGMPNTSGLVARKGLIASSDATAVARWRAAGAIPMGVTNVSELCMWMESHNRVYGRTNNPYDHGRTAGGSSGGEGAIVGAGASPLGLAADIGGSIRMPAFFNGIFGHKPTGGLVPGTGQFPMAENEARRYLTTGPVSRYVEDLMPALRLLAGPDGLDAECRPFDIGDPDGVDISTLRVLNVLGNGAIKVADDLRHAQIEAAHALAERGAKVTRQRIEGLKQSLFIWATMLSEAEDSSYRSRLGQGRKISATRELGRWFRGKSDHTLPSIGLALLEQVPERLPSSSEKYMRLGRELRARLIQAIGPRGVMLYPSYASVAPKHNQPLWLPVRWVYTAIFNVMEFPVTQVPLGLNAEGIPLGVQVVGTPGNDHLTIAVATALAEDFGGWSVPSALPI